MVPEPVKHRCHEYDEGEPPHQQRGHLATRERGDAIVDLSKSFLF